MIAEKEWQPTSAIEPVAFISITTRTVVEAFRIVASGITVALVRIVITFVNILRKMYYRDYLRNNLCFQNGQPTEKVYVMPVSNVSIGK